MSTDIPCPHCDGEATQPEYMGDDKPAGVSPCDHCEGTGRAPLIVGVALRTQDGVVVSLPKPARHHNVIHQMTEAGYTREQIARSDQGFVTDRGRWVRRVPAKLMAQDAGQIIRDSSGGSRELFSEDVW